MLIHPDVVKDFYKFDLLILRTTGVIGLFLSLAVLRDRTKILSFKWKRRHRIAGGL